MIYWCVALRRPSPVINWRRCWALTPPLKCWRHSTVQHSSIPKPAIGRKSRVFASSRSLRRTFCRNALCGKLERCAYTMVKKTLKICLLVSTDTNATDGSHFKRQEAQLSQRGRATLDRIIRKLSRMNSTWRLAVIQYTLSEIVATVVLVCDSDGQVL